MIFILGFISQVLFFTRTLLQWILSERAKKVLSPSIYWILSIIASYLFCIYGWFRNDFFNPFRSNHIILHLYLEFERNESVE